MPATTQSPRFVAAAPVKAQETSEVWSSSSNNPNSRFYSVQPERWQDAVGGEVRWTYDGAGWPDVQTVEGAGGGASEVEMSYDADGLITGVAVLGQPNTTYTVSRDASTGLVSGTSLASTVTTQHWNEHGELDSVRLVQGGASLYAAQYDRDALGRITRLREQQLDVSTDVGYHRDARGRLTAVRDSVGHTDIERCTYDPNGNRLTRKVGAGPLVTSTYDAQDRQVSTGGVTYTYTGQGERRVRGGDGAWQQLQYDALGNLLTVRSASDSVVYGVDGRGRRITRKQGTSQTHRWLYQGQHALVAELDGSDVLKRRYVHASRAHVPDLMVVKGAADTLYRIVTDHLGSVRLVVRVSDGVVVQSRRYSAWGEPEADTQPGWLPLGYAGGIEDPATGLVRFGARDYEPSSGRWLSRDPIGFAGGDANLYAYVANDPVGNVDPSGMLVETAVDAVSLGISLMDYLCDPSAENAGWLGVDALAFAVPFVPGTGVVRAGAKAAGGLPLQRLTGYTDHGVSQVIGRDGGRGVHPAAIVDALRNPTKVRTQADGATKYVGARGTVVLNSEGRLITAWGQPRNPGAGR